MSVYNSSVAADTFAEKIMRYVRNTPPEISKIKCGYRQRRCTAFVRVIKTVTRRLPGFERLKICEAEI